VIGAMQNSAIIGPVYEFAFLLDADLRYRNIRDRVPITLITPEPYVGHLGLGWKATRAACWKLRWQSGILPF